MNNPALQLLLLATVEGYKFRWPTGADKLLLVSVGTGHWETRDSAEDVLRGRSGWRRRLFKSRPIWDWAVEVPMMLMDDASALSQALLQLLSVSPTAVKIDSEIGDLTADWRGRPPMLTYLRYDASLSDEDVAKLGVPLDGVGEARLRRMDAPDTVEKLYKIGELAAQRDVKAGHFGEGFDVG